MTDLAGLKVPPVCPEGSNDLLACVEGNSIAPLLENPKQEWKKAAFSQYPRPAAGLTYIDNKPPFNRTSHHEDVMGYAIRVDSYRFVEWYGFNRTTAKPNFGDIWGTELYNHTESVKFFNDENVNLAGDPSVSGKIQELREMLKAGWRAAQPPGYNN